MKEKSIKKCPKCGGQMVVTETSTFDGTVVYCKCKECDYSNNYDR